MFILKTWIFVKYYFIFFLIIVVKKLENINDNNIITMRYQLHWNTVRKWWPCIKMQAWNLQKFVNRSLSTELHQFVGMWKKLLAIILHWTREKLILGDQTISTKSKGNVKGSTRIKKVSWLIYITTYCTTDWG